MRLINSHRQKSERFLLTAIVLVKEYVMHRSENIEGGHSYKNNEKRGHEKFFCSMVWEYCKTGRFMEATSNT